MPANRLTFIEKLICEYTWGGPLTDIDFVRNSKYYATKFKELTGHDYTPDIDLRDFSITTKVSFTNTIRYEGYKPLPNESEIIGILTRSYLQLLKNEIG